MSYTTMKLEAERNTVVGATCSINLRFMLPDPFLDSYKEELLTCHGMMDEMVLMDGTPYVTVLIDKAFLKRMLKSHIYSIRNIIQDNHAEIRRT